MSDALRRLAERAGIAAGYHDIWGRYRTPEDAVLRELLASMGLLSTPEADPEAALRQAEAADWQRMLPPVRVVREGEAAALRVVLPEDALAAALIYRLVTEDGAIHEQQAAVSQLPSLETRELDGRRLMALELPLSIPLAPGYHRCEVECAGAAASMPLIVAPPACYQPEVLADGGRVWGPALQLYALRSERNWGIGDFTDLAAFGEHWAEQGAHVVGLNPVHAMFVGNPAHASPYSPSSRRFLNLLYLDVEAVPDFADCESARERVRSGEFQLRLRALREAERVDYVGVAAAKLAVLEQLYQSFRERHLSRDRERARAFHEFQQREGEALRLYALYEALWEHFHAENPEAWSWLDWPEAFQDPHSAEVEAFYAQHRERVEFYAYLQWQAEAQLSEATARLERAGLAIGLYLDLAVSVDRGGADGWRNRSIYAMQASVGAPPDEFARNGQDWGLPPFDPRRLREEAYAPLIGALRENMRRAGALRIDHVMGLMRLFWIPLGRSAADGAYVHYPFEEMLGIVALESHRNRCLVIGEDLGTVPEAVREAMARERLLSYKVLIFEQGEGGRFKAPKDYAAEALATVSTHDLPTLAGYWEGRDLALRAELGLYEDDEVRGRQLVERAQDRSQLLLALEREGLLPEGASADPATLPEMTPELARAVHVYLARSRASLMMVQPEDVLGMLEQVNLPGAPDAQHPNWRRKLTLPLEQWPHSEEVLRFAAALREARPGPEPCRRRVRAKGLRIPRATYRLQLNRHFTIAEATRRVPYLARLGVSHVYCSPYLRARPGSEHGYDIIDHNAFNPEIGSEADFQRFSEALERHGMAQIMDVVPNHMGVMGADNAWWLDVLENGPASVYAPYFDIDWKPVKRELHDKLLLPILGDAYGEVLERGELQLAFDADRGSFSLRYYEHCAPIAPGVYPRLLGRRMEALALRLGADNPQLLELQSLVSAFQHLPGRDELSLERVLERHRDVQLHKQRLARLCAESSDIADYLQEVVAEFNGRPGEPESFDALHELLEAQAYRLAHWHAAADEINYRRFFDIHDLAALRMEDPRVFDATHQLILSLITRGELDALRIDHPDGLYDPEAYFQRLQERAAQAMHSEPPALYLLVEKILASHEALVSSWPVHGTTGYEFANQVNGILIDQRSAGALRRFYASFSGERLPFDELLYKCKRMIMKYALASELAVLAAELNRISEADRHTRDFTLNRLRSALAELVAWLPVYRTYEREGVIGAHDREYIDYAIGRAREGTRAEEAGVYDFLRRVLLREDLPEATRERAARFSMRLQQYTGAVMAKGLEDTAFYRYFPLVSLNEVGGDPRRFGLTVEAFHAANSERRESWPHSLLATSTHDNKRSEDVRARISVLSEIPGAWRRRVSLWARLNEACKRQTDGSLTPSRNDEYLLYQTLIGAWPLEIPDETAHDEFVARIEVYMLKAVREAKQHTSWINRNPAYEEALSGFVHEILRRGSPFLDDFLPFQRWLSRFGLYNSLSQVALKLTAPGVPDIYQGNELWDFSLVDPDNRRPVDYSARESALASLDEVAAPELLATLEDGRAKLMLTTRLLALRQRHETLFRDGDYLPLASSGTKAEHLCAFARQHGSEAVVMVAPRLYVGLLDGEERLPIGDVWGDTRLELGPLGAETRWRDLISGRMHAAGETLLLAEALAEFPVAVLVTEPG